MTNESSNQSACKRKTYYRIYDCDDGTCDVWLTPGLAIPATDDLTGRIDYNFRVLAVRGVDPDDPQWGGDLEEHIRRHYDAWCASAEEVEI